MLIITPALKSLLINKGLADANGSIEHYRTKVSEAIASGAIEVAEVQKAAQDYSGTNMSPAKQAEVVNAIADAVSLKMRGGRVTVTDPNSPDPGAVFGVDASRVRVKNSKESYLTVKSVGRHVKSGQPVLNEQAQPCLTVSELEYAKGGAFLKHVAKKSGVACKFTDHDRDLLEDSYEHDRWVGLDQNREWRKDLSGLECKALLSDSTSGGVEVNPEWFDANLITFPLLSGELFPLVDLVEVPRGKSVEGASVSNPTVTWGTEDGTAISLFNTDSFISAIDTTIHTVSVAVEVGRDFLSDAAADVGRTIMNNIGERFKKELDNVIANGNGTNRPEGVFVASGVGSVTTGGTWGINDVEALLFGIGKQYRTSTRCAFLSNDTTYARVRSLATGISGDNQRMFGSDEESYNVLGRPWRIQNDTANTKAAFGDFSRFRMYRRLGFSIEIVSTGETLARSNKVLFLARGRFGGRVIDASAFAVAVDCQA